MASILILGIILATIFLISKIIISLLSKSSEINGKLPPGTKGWPLIGESIAFASYPEKFVRDRMTKYSPDVFRTSIAGQNVAVLCGPAGNKFLFSNTKIAKPWWPKVVSQALMFESCYHSSTLILDHSFLKLDSIRDYVAVMDSTSREHVERHWVPYDQVKVHELAKEYTFTLSCRLFMNYDEEKVKELTRPFFAVVRGITSAPVNIPGTSFHGAMKGGNIIKKKLVEIIKQRKTELLPGNNEQKGQDLLGKLLLAVDENGKFYCEEEIANKIIGYLIASFVTPSNALTFAISHLADHPYVYDQVLKEQQEIAKSKKAGELLNWADIQKMKYSWNVVCESMRLISPSQGAFKEVLSGFTFSGFNIPKGWKAFWAVHSTHKDPRYFVNPEKFDPSRFEGNGPPPYTFVPFGGGPRMCAGMEFARIEILVFLHNLVTRFRIKKVNPNEKINHNPDPFPVEGLPMCLQAHEK